MPFIFILVFGILGGFGLCLIARKVLKDSERAYKARIAREEAERNDG